MAKAKPITGLDIHAPTAVNARLIASTRLAELFTWEQYVDDPYRVRELHNMRIAAKRLRYTFELFEDVLPASMAPLRQEVVQLQEELGDLHDSDVMIASLRLCLGALDGGSGYAYALAQAHKIREKADFVLNPAMMAYLLDPEHALSAEERHGLETLLADLHQQRSEQHHAFHQHWHQLKADNFRLTVLNMLDS